MGCLRVLLTVGFTVVQFTAVQQPFIAVDIVPIADFWRLEVSDWCAAIAAIRELPVNVSRRPKTGVQLSPKWSFVRAPLFGFYLSEPAGPEGCLSELCVVYTASNTLFSIAYSKHAMSPHY